MDGLKAVIETLRAIQGQPLRCTALARQIGISRHRVWQCIELLEGRGIVYTLPAWCPPPLRPGRRVAGAPVVYLRQPRRPQPEERLLSCANWSAEAETGFRSRMIDQVMLREQARSPSSRFGHYSTPAMSRAALIVDTTLLTVGFQFPLHPCPGKRRWTGLSKSIREGWVDRGLVVYPGSRIFFASRWVVAVPAASFLAGYRSWMEALEKGTAEALRLQVHTASAALPAGWRPRRLGGPLESEGPARASGPTGSPA